MAAIDWILNLTCVLIWLNWRSIRFTTAIRPDNRSLLQALKRAEPNRAVAWSCPAILLLILVVRAFFYYQIGTAVNWTPTLELGAVALPFRSDRFPRIILYSFLSGGLWIGGLYAWLLLLSAINRKLSDAHPMQRLIRCHLGILDKLPAALKILLPCVLAALAWTLLHPMLARMAIVPPATGGGQIWKEAAVLAVATMLVWKWLLIGIFVLHILNSYVYLGTAPLWKFISITANHLLAPVSALPVRLGRIDLSPLIGIAIVVGASETLAFWLPQLFQQL